MEISDQITKIELSKLQTNEGNINFDPDFNSRSPSGDYENIALPPSSDCSSTDFQDEIQTNNYRIKIMGLVNKMDKGIEQTLQEMEEIKQKFDVQEEECECRKYLFKLFLKLHTDQDVAIAEYTKKNESLDIRIKNLEKRILSKENRDLDEICKEY